MKRTHFYYPGLIDERKRMLDERQTSVAGPLRIVSNAETLHFCPKRDIVHTDERPCANRALEMPSRIGDRLFYRDGRVEQINPTGAPA
jgi:hypothetical protein